MEIQEGVSSQNWPVYRIGFIADIQFSDCDPQWNFNKTRRRFYRNSVAVLSRAFEWWSELGGLDFAVNLGDVIDGRNRGEPGLGESALYTVLDRMAKGASKSFCAIVNG